MVTSRKALYKDDYVAVYPDELVIRTYYFPLGGVKHIPISSIQHIFFKEQASFKDFYVTKDWGMTINPVWWACDLQRHFKHLHYNVVVDTGEWVRKGFTVTDVNAFLSELGQLKPGMPIEHGFPRGFRRENAAPIQQFIPVPNASNPGYPPLPEFIPPPKYEEVEGVKYEKSY